MNITTLLNRAVILDSLASTSVKDGLSANRGKELFDGLQNKLDISSYNEYFKGVYLTFNALTTANPTAISGCYALVDAGVGDEADFYWYDVEGGWVTSGGMVLANTDVLVEGSTNLYFTTARVRSSLLTGLAAGTNTAILSSDTLLVALAKLQAQIPNLASYATTSSVTTGLSANLDPTINTQLGTPYILGTVGTDNDGKTYLRMNNSSANTVTIPSTHTKPISIRQVGTGTTTLAGGAGVTLNGTLVFTAQHQTKTVIPLGGGIYDVVG